MHFHVFPYPTHGTGRQTAAGRRDWRSLPQSSERIQAGPGVQSVAPCLLPSCPTALGRGYQRRPCLVASGDDDVNRR